LLVQNAQFKTQKENSNPKNELRSRCYNYSIKVIKLINSFPEKRIYWVLSDQLLRSATSIGANVIEAKSASSKRDFIKYYEIALKSSNETLYWLGLLRDALKLKEEELQYLIGETQELSKILAASLLTMKGKR
jgi:four helix bundle protein